MNNQVEAIYENGVFRPLRPIELPEQQRVIVYYYYPDVQTVVNRNDVPDAAKADVQEPWTADKNTRRCDLIDKEIEGVITDAERIELEALQCQAIAYRDRVAPLPIEGARKLHQQLLRKKRATR